MTTQAKQPAYSKVIRNTLLITAALSRLNRRASYSDISEDLGYKIPHKPFHIAMTILVSSGLVASDGTHNRGKRYMMDDVGLTVWDVIERGKRRGFARIAADKDDPLLSRPVGTVRTGDILPSGE